MKKGIVTDYGWGNGRIDAEFDYLDVEYKCPYCDCDGGACLYYPSADQYEWKAAHQHFYELELDCEYCGKTMKLEFP